MFINEETTPINSDYVIDRSSSPPTKSYTKLGLITACVLLLAISAFMLYGSADAGKSRTTSAISFAESTPPDYCWKDTHTRGAGSIPSDCGAGRENAGGLCYDNCKAGYSGDGGILCLKNDCPSGYSKVGCCLCSYSGNHVDKGTCTDSQFPKFKDGLCYHKDVDTGLLVKSPNSCDPGFFGYGGLCYQNGVSTWQLSKPCDNWDWGRARCGSCNGPYHPSAGMCYANSRGFGSCSSGYENVAGLCYAKSKSIDCPNNYVLTGLMCNIKNPTYAVDSYTRGAGVIPDNCGGGEYDTGLCYSKCRSSSFQGVGPVCWANCPAGYVSCGMGCAKDAATCAFETADQVMAPLGILANALTAGAASKVTSASKMMVQAGKFAAKAKKASEALSKTYEAGSKAKNFKVTLEKLGELKTSADFLNEYASTYANTDYDATIKTTVNNDKSARTDSQKFQAAMKAVNEKLEKDMAKMMAEAADPSGIVAAINAYNKPKCA